MITTLLYSQCYTISLSNWSVSVGVVTILTNSVLYECLLSLNVKRKSKSKQMKFVRLRWLILVLKSAPKEAIGAKENVLLNTVTHRAHKLHRLSWFALRRESLNALSSHDSKRSQPLNIAGVSCLCIRRESCQLLRLKTAAGGVLVQLGCSFFGCDLSGSEHENNLCSFQAQ